MKINKEIIVGIIMTAFLCALLLLVHNRTVHETAGRKFTLNATFSKADGLLPTSEVRLAGMKVGGIGEQKLSSDGHHVIVQLVFDQPVEIPTDSSVLIETDGIMGAKHLEILPGGDEEIMETGDSFSYTQDSLIISELLDKVNTYLRKKKSTTEEEEKP